jgi:RNA polymerase sigma factor (sigma-70 family)
MTDAELVKQVINGNQDAGRFLVVKFQRLVYHIVSRVLVRQEDVADVCQDVFMKVFEKIRSYRGSSKLSTWIASVAYNTAATHYAREKRRNLKNATNKPLAEDGNWTAADDTTYERADLQVYLLKIIESMPMHYRTVLTLYHLEEFSYREIEEITAMPEGTIKSYLSRARIILRSKLVKIQNAEHEKIFERY